MGTSRTTLSRVAATHSRLHNRAMPETKRDDGQPPVPATLGDVLYSPLPATLVTEQSWALLVRAVAAREPLALHALYERAHRPVFRLVLRITGDHGAAGELTVDVFHDVWRNAASYRPASGTVFAWIMNQARTRAIAQLHGVQRATINTRIRPGPAALQRVPGAQARPSS